MKEILLVSSDSDLEKKVSERLTLGSILVTWAGCIPVACHLVGAHDYAAIAVDLGLEDGARGFIEGLTNRQKVVTIAVNRRPTDTPYIDQILRQTGCNHSCSIYRLPDLLASMMGLSY